MMSMFGFIDATTGSHTVKRVRLTDGGYVDGIYEHQSTSETAHQASVQPVSMREIEDVGARRISDYRKLYINDGTGAGISPADIWEIDGERYETVSYDYRPTRDYLKVVVARVDDQ